MKAKIISGVIMFFLALPSALSILGEQYSAYNDAIWVSSDNGASSSKYQTFSGSAGNLDIIELRVKKVGTPASSLGVQLWSTTGSPTSPSVNLANYTNVSIANMTDITSNATLVQGNKLIAAGTEYAIVVYSGSLSGNAPQIRVQWGGATYANGHEGAGNAVLTSWGGDENPNSDIPFSIYLNETSVSDTTPPRILSYNLSTPSGDCTSWSSGACSTGDTTPTVSITTDDNAFCAIGLVDKNFTHYDGLAVNRSCENGGTQSLICTLRPQDELVYEDSTLYIGCKNTNNYENATSTSGTLSLIITGLEARSDAAIGVGVQNALLSGYTNYTNQQVYARKLDGTQDYGTFDWVAKKGSTVWAFNHVTKGESHVGLFNLTPVLYVLEMANNTNSTITSIVEAFINVNP